MAVLVIKYVAIGTFVCYICLLICIAERTTMDHVTCFTQIKDLDSLDRGCMLSHVGRDLHASLITTIC